MSGSMVDRLGINGAVVSTVADGCARVATISMSKVGNGVSDEYTVGCMAMEVAKDSAGRDWVAWDPGEIATLTVSGMQPAKTIMTNKVSVKEYSIASYALFILPRCYKVVPDLLQFCNTKLYQKRLFCWIFEQNPPNFDLSAW